MTTNQDAMEAAARAIYDVLEGPVNNQDASRQQRQWELSKQLAQAAMTAMLSARPTNGDR